MKRARRHSQPTHNAYLVDLGVGAVGGLGELEDNLHGAAVLGKELEELAGLGRLVRAAQALDLVEDPLQPLRIVRCRIGPSGRV